MITSAEIVVSLVRAKAFSQALRKFRAGEFAGRAGWRRLGHHAHGLGRQEVGVGGSRS